jgi:hypothetical protein
MAADDDDNSTEHRLLGLPLLVKVQTVGNGSMADLGEEYVISTVPAFTEAAAEDPTGQPSDTESGTPSLEMKKTPRPAGQGALKL